MKKEIRRKNKGKILKAMAFSEIFVMILASFAFAFSLSAGLVSGADTTGEKIVTVEYKSINPIQSDTKFRYNNQWEYLDTVSWNPIGAPRWLPVTEMSWYDGGPKYREIADNLANLNEGAGYQYFNKFVKTDPNIKSFSGDVATWSTDVANSNKNAVVKQTAQELTDGGYSYIGKNPAGNEIWYDSNKEEYFYLDESNQKQIYPTDEIIKDYPNLAENPAPAAAGDAKNTQDNTAGGEKTDAVKSPPTTVPDAIIPPSAIPKVIYSADGVAKAQKEYDSSKSTYDKYDAQAKTLNDLYNRDLTKNPLTLQEQRDLIQAGIAKKDANGNMIPLTKEEIKTKFNQAADSRDTAKEPLDTATKALAAINAAKPKYASTVSELTGGAATSINDLKGLPEADLAKLGVYKDIKSNPDGTFSVIKGSQQYTVNAAGDILGAPVDLGVGAPSEYSIFGFFKWTTAGWGHTLGNLVEGVAWAGAVITAIKVFESIGLIPEEYAKPLYQSITGGILAGKGAYGLLKTAVSKNWISSSGFMGENAAVIGFGVGAVVAYLIFSNQYKKEKTETKTLTFKCMSWQAPRGGEKCGECNKDPMRPCSEYRCKSLGQSCELLNKGTGQEKCEWVNRNDAISPGIKPWNQVLTNGYVYAQVKPRPAGGGSATAGMVIQRAIENTNGNKCVDPYTPIEFGILTYNEKNQAEPAQCKIEYKHTNSFSEMEYYLGDSNLYLTNHSQKLSMPSISSLRTMNENESEGLEMEQTPGEYTFYVRCADANGNENRDEFAVRFCIDEGPDMTAPIIKGTNFGNQTTPVPFGQDNLSIEVYTNEPAKCFWEREDRDYNYMGNEMTCSNKVWEMNAELLYTCKTTLTSIEDRKNNDFFFRCVDSAGNSMQEGYQFTVIGTQPLDIIAVGPNGTTAGSTSIVKTTLHVETANGYNNGEARCFYSPTGDNSSYIEFFYNTSEFSNIHDQVLDLGSGTYNYYFRCIDLGGNSAENSTTFSLEMDRESPLIVRAYNENNQLLVITDESSDCKYNTQSCSFNFNDGLSMSNANSTVHETEWKEQNYYIKCADGYNNQPYPTECSIVVRPYLG